MNLSEIRVLGLRKLAREQCLFKIGDIVKLTGESVTVGNDN